MARVMELFVIVNALAGIATFLGVRFVWRRSRDVTKRGFDVIHDKKEDQELRDGGTNYGEISPPSLNGEESSLDSRSVHLPSDSH